MEICKIMLQMEQQQIYIALVSVKHFTLDHDNFRFTLKHVLLSDNLLCWWFIQVMAFVFP